MHRKEFIKMCGLLGVGLPLQTSLAACGSGDRDKTAFEGKVLIIGAGAAGMASAYLLKQQGIEFEVLEASPSYGGRMKRTNDFVDFPIPLGAEWLHVERGVFDEIINDSSASYHVPTTPYDHDHDFGLFQGHQISTEDIGFTIDQKFIGGSWFDFFETYILPSVADQIKYNHVVSAIDYSGDQVIIGTNEGQYSCDKVIVTIPIKMMQARTISFKPELPSDKISALDELTVWDGCKAFIEFSTQFYPTFIGFDIGREQQGEKMYYDASYGQSSQRHVLGLFAVGTGTLPYVNLSDEDLIAYILHELDEIFEGQASPNYIQHIFQNWNTEPHIGGAYLTRYEKWRKVRTLGQPVGENLIFAGCGYTDGEDWSSVHAAARSAIRAIEIIAG
ncbi:MAG: FAD-dependent oxidoreductase [Bacteroidota bacterium]